jgi:glutamate N-acetyltransferase/amino-acid N-acetyltransferase
VHGADPNWGRIVCAAGRAGVSFDVEQATVHVGGVLLFEHGLPHDDAAPQAAEHMKLKDIRIDVDLGTGGGAAATIWTCDLTAEYVRINGEYRT